MTADSNAPAKSEGSAQPKVHFWDMDHTLIDNDCDVSWKKYLTELGMAGPDSKERADFFYQQYQNQCLDVNAFMQFQLCEIKGKSKQEMAQHFTSHFDKHIKPQIYQEAIQMIKQQQKSGDKVCIISATNRFLVTPLARYLGVDHVLATELGIDDDDCFTGTHDGVYCVGEGKIAHMKRFLGQHCKDIGLYQCSYYGDSDNDVPILKQIGFPNACNPTPGLRTVALQHKWSVYDFK